MGGMGGIGGGMGPGWGIDYGQPASGYETKRSAKPTHKTKSVNHDHKQIVVH
jgi:SAM-dependent MidA family methyltransferase